MLLGDAQQYLIHQRRFPRTRFAKNRDVLANSESLAEYAALDFGE